MYVVKKSYLCTEFCAEAFFMYKKSPRIGLLLLWLMMAHMTVCMAGSLYTEQERDSLWKEDDFVRISLIVADPGEQLYSMLGHACLRMECPAYERDYIFSYESEDVSSRVGKFLRGELQMRLMRVPTREYLSQYIAQCRGVHAYAMNMDIDTKRRLWQVLDQHVRAGSQPYDYFTNGCAKAVVRVVDEAIAAQESAKITYREWPERLKTKTQRELVRMAIDQAVEEGKLNRTKATWNTAFLYALVGTDGDRDCAKREKLIVPTDLVEVWQSAEQDGRPLLSQEAETLTEAGMLVEAKPRENTGGGITPLMVAIALLLIAIAPYGEYVVLTVVTTLGAGMMYLWLVSSLPCTEWNWLLVPLNILPAIAWRWRRYWALPWAGVLTAWEVAMMVYPHQLVDSAYLVLTAALIVAIAKQSDWVRSKLKKQL